MTLGLESFFRPKTHWFWKKLAENDLFDDTPFENHGVKWSQYIYSREKVKKSDFYLFFYFPVVDFPF